jgi:hypothetical protein
MVHLIKMLYPHAVTETLFHRVLVHTDPYSGGSTNLRVCLNTVALKMKANKKKKKKDWFLNISPAGIFYFSTC